MIWKQSRWKISDSKFFDEFADQFARLIFTILPHEVHFLPTQSLASSLFHIHFGPQASDSSLLLSSKMHHDVKSWSLQVITEASEASLCCCGMLWPFILYCWTSAPLLPIALWSHWSRLSCVPQGWSQVSWWSARKLYIECMITCWFLRHHSFVRASSFLNTIFLSFPIFSLSSSHVLLHDRIHLSHSPSPKIIHKV